VSRVNGAAVIGVMLEAFSACGGLTTRTNDDVSSGASHGGATFVAGHGVGVGGMGGSSFAAGGVDGGGSPTPVVGGGEVGGAAGQSSGLLPTSGEFDIACGDYARQTVRLNCRECAARSACDEHWARVTDTDCWGGYDCVERNCLPKDGTSAVDCACMKTCFKPNSSCGAAWYGVLTCTTNVCKTSCPN